MRISRVRMHNFRNFRDVDVKLGEHVVILGENKVGKTNFLHALRLVLDPSLSDSARQLQESDFWDGLLRPLTEDDYIEISVEFTDFDTDDCLIADFADYLSSSDPITASLTYVFRPKPSIFGRPRSEDDYEFLIYGGTRNENYSRAELPRRTPLIVLPALRDAERDLSTWRRSPMKPLLDEVARVIDAETLQKIATDISEVENSLLDVEEFGDLSKVINDRLKEMFGGLQGLEVALGLATRDPYRLIRDIRMYIDGGTRGISDASLGSSNLLYLVLKLLDLERLVRGGSRDHTFLAIEEPEAHLHPHLQRLIYRNFLRMRAADVEPGGTPIGLDTTNYTILLTTHSPHIASVTPLDSIVVLRQESGGNETIAVSTAELVLDDSVIADLERYIDVTRGEILFAKGVLLVEGDAERYLVPVLGELIGYNLDKLGISVCSVSGTNFAPYVKLLGPTGLNVPFAVLTDLDPQDNGECLGHSRVNKLLKEIMDDDLYHEALYNKRLPDAAPDHGVFLNSHTFEIELLESGYTKVMLEAIIDLTDNGAASRRAEDWSKSPSSLDKNQLLKDIIAIGKGRFAQRLAVMLKTGSCPDYIRKAIEYVESKYS